MSLRNFPLIAENRTRCFTEDRRIRQMAEMLSFGPV